MIFSGKRVSSGAHKELKKNNLKKTFFKPHHAEILLGLIHMNFREYLLEECYKHSHYAGEQQMSAVFNAQY